MDLQAAKEELEAIEKRKLELKEQIEHHQKVLGKAESAFKKCGFEDPADFVVALIERFGLLDAVVDKFNLKAKGSRRNTPAKESTSSTPGKGKRTKVTPGLRDKIKALLDDGRSNKEIQAELGVSYPVVKKVKDGEYDEL